MRRSIRKQSFPLIRAGFVLLIVLIAIYIPFKVYIANSDTIGNNVTDGTSISIFVTNELGGYREPCG